MKCKQCGAYTTTTFCSYQCANEAAPEGMWSDRLEMRASELQVAAWRTEAKRCGLTLSAWARSVLDRAAYPKHPTSTETDG